VVVGLYRAVESPAAEWQPPAWQRAAMNLLWLTDPHLNFLPSAESSRVLGQYLCQEHAFDAVILSGDIAEAPCLLELLACFAQGVAPRPVYFVLGNHDYYLGSFASVQRDLRTGLREANLVWLDEAGAILLDDDTALVGHQGWFDAHCGDPRKSKVIMSDFELIAELRARYVNQLNWVSGGRSALLAEVHALGQRAASTAKGPLLQALQERRTVVFVTHFPPFEGACWHEGAISDKHWLPWFTCEAMGSMLSEAARAHPDRRILTLCGHTHSAGVYDHAPNLRVLTGPAVYGAPDVAELLATPVPAWSSS
jgi:predicted phosphohydrolase